MGISALSRGMGSSNVCQMQRGKIVWLIWLCSAAFAVHLAGRESVRLDTGWRFKLGDLNGAEQPSFNDADWQVLTLPHNWGWEDAQQGREYYRGPGWYRLELPIAAPKQGRRYFLRFEAAGSVADVYVNGNHIGQHRGAFGAFCFEITRQLSPNGTNLLAVRVSNAAEKDIAPLSGDFCVFGGLYRPVHLIETADVCFDLTDHGSPGVAWFQTSVARTQAVVDLTAQVSNGTRRRREMTLVATILDAEGKQVAASEQHIVSQPNVTEPFHARLVIQNPRLWQGRKDPYLYRAVAELRDRTNATDTVTQPLGLRWFGIDPERGFLLNGEPYPIRGVNRHQDRPDKGWAISEADQEEDLGLILEMGATAVRCAHYQHSDYFYSICDRAGLLVWAELPLVDRIAPGPAFAENARSQLLDLIRQNVNHPSIFCWSLFNELRPNNPDPHRLLQDLHKLARAEDPTRPTIAATCTFGWPQMNKITDWLGWNIYPGWYPEWGELEEIPARLESYRATGRLPGYCVSEYGAGANIEHHESPARKPKHDGQWHPEEWQAVVHETLWPQMAQRNYIWGTFLWNMFDFTSWWRNEGGIKGRNDKGLVTYDRKVRKDAFYFYKANWSDEPVLYITSRRFTERTNLITEVKVYSNAPEVELLVNGVSHGRRGPLSNCIFVWPDIQLRQGQNKIEARAQKAGQALTDTCIWTVKLPVGERAN